MSFPCAPLLLSLLLISLHTYGQQSTSSTYQIKSGTVYDKESGKLLTEDEMAELFANGNPILEPRMDKYGQPSSFTVDRSGSGSRINTRDASKRPLPGEEVLPFIMKSLSGESLDSEALRGQFILLHFELVVSPPIFSLSKFNEMQSSIESIKKEDSLVAISVFQSSQQDIEAVLELSQYPSQIVADGRGFSVRYQITDFPSFLLIGKRGELIGYYKRSEWNKLKSDLAKY